MSNNEIQEQQRGEEVYKKDNFQFVYDDDWYHDGYWKMFKEGERVGIYNEDFTQRLGD